MAPVDSIIAKKKESNTKKEIQLTAVVINKLINNKLIDQVISDYIDLTGGGKDMKGWYATAIRRLGVDRFCQLASIARAEGKNPARYFSWLLKRETA